MEARKSASDHSKNSFLGSYMDVSKNRGGILPPKMDGLFHGKPVIKIHDLGGFPIIFGLTPI